jgi:acetolactate synthase-1/2/3 large subunit
MPMWHIPARRFAAADSKVALEQIAALVRDENLRASRPSCYLGSGGGSPGWVGGGAVGAKLACSAERAVVSLVGDGCFLSGVPSSAQCVARRHHAPSLSIIYDNRGWAAPGFSPLNRYRSGRLAGR